MTRTKIAAIATAAMLSLSAVTAAAQHLFADVTGKWAFSVAAPDQTRTSEVVLKQEGGKVSGTWDIPEMGGVRPLTGTVTGDTVMFTFTIDMGGQQAELRGTGVVKDNNAMVGQLELAGMGAFPFDAKKLP